MSIYNNAIKIGELMKTVVQTHITNLKSVRVILTYASALIWMIFGFKTFSFVKEIMLSVEKEQLASIVVSLSDKILMVFYMNSFIFLIMLLVYVLKKTDFKLELGPIKFETKSNNSTETDLGKSNKIQPVASVDPRTGEKIG